MPVFGSMTSNSEFEFLTGDSVAMLPSNSIAYQFNVKPDARTMVSTMKDQGYRTVAMHHIQEKTGTGMPVMPIWDLMSS